MRFLLAALTALLCCPAVAAAAPFGEPPFVPLGGDCAAQVLRMAADGALAPEGSVALPDLWS